MFSNDLYITYDWNDDDFFMGGYCGFYGVNSLTAGDTIILYTDQECLQPTTPDNFQIAPENNHPKLTWDHSEPWNGNVTYTVWRNYQGGSYSVIAQGLINNMYIDNSVTLCCGGPPRTYAYKVRAWSGNNEKPSPEYAGPVSIISNAPIEGKQLAEAGVDPLEFFSYSFPSPFNSSTTITYGLPEDSRVALKIYDRMGRQILITAMFD